VADRFPQLYDIGLLNRDPADRAHPFQHGFRQIKGWYVWPACQGYCLRVENELCIPLVHQLPVPEQPFKQWRQVPDVEQGVVNIEREDRRHHSAALAFLSGCG
jgi:hypothetical protein